MWVLRRLPPPALDLLLATHWHEDHLDRPTLVRWAGVPAVRFGGASSCVGRVRAWGWPTARTETIDRGQTFALRDVTVTATFARHDVPGALAEDAVGFLLDIAGVRCWVVADSEYDARLRPLREERIDVMFVPINGGGGNMDAHEAALLAWRVRPRIAVPMHFGMWADAGYGPGATLDPEQFRATLGRLGGPTLVRVLERGEVVVFAAGEGSDGGR